MNWQLNPARVAPAFGGKTLVGKRVELIHERAMGMIIFFSGALTPSIVCLGEWQRSEG